MKTFRNSIKAILFIMIGFVSVNSVSAIELTYGGQYAYFSYIDNNSKKEYTTKAKLNGTSTKACVGPKDSEYFCKTAQGLAEKTLYINAPHVHGYSTGTGTPNNWQ